LNGEHTQRAVGSGTGKNDADRPPWSSAREIRKSSIGMRRPRATACSKSFSTPLTMVIPRLGGMM